MTGVAGLLMALALTATGCQAASNPNGGLQAAPTLPPVSKVADFDPSMTTLGEEYEAAYGQDRAVSTPLATAGLKILSVMFDEYPEYTLGGFVPTDTEFNTVATQLAPLINSKAMLTMDSKWRADKTLPVMTSYRTKTDKDGVHGYTYTTEEGEQCTDGEKPYEYKTQGLTLGAGTDESGSQAPIFMGHVDVTVHCKEGTLLKGQMFAWFPMQEVNGNWIVLDTYEVNPAGPFKISAAG